MNSHGDQHESTCSRCGTLLCADEAEGGCPRCFSAMMLSLNLLSPRAAGATDVILQIGDYELLEEIARGGMGIVYRARQKSLNREVAVKLMRDSTFAGPEEIRRFRVEAAAAAKLKHPNIVAIHEVGEQQGQHYFAMDLVEGGNLAQRTHDKPLTPERAAELVVTIADAVQYAHAQGVLHRDLKPSNVLIDANDQPFVTDFGLARPLDADSSLTVTGQVLGTPGYMPPEQASGNGSLGPAADIYSLGALLYHLLTGRAPFVGGTLTDTLRHVIEQEPVSPQLLNPEVPRNLASVCLKCLAKRPENRYPSASDIAADLRRFIRGEPVIARPTGQTERFWRWCRRNPSLVGAIGAVTALLLIVAIGSPIAAFRVSAARDAERFQRLRADERELTTRQNLYSVDMQLAQLALDGGDRQQAAMLLERERPQPGQRDLRGWEWRYFWQLARGDELFTLGTHSNAVTALDISANGRFLITGSYDHSVRVWSLLERRQLAILEFPSTVYSVQFSPDGRLFAVGGSRTLKVLLTDSREIVFETALATEVRAVVFTPDGKRLASFSTDGQVNIWDLDKKVRNVAAQAARLNGTLRGALAISPDGSTLAIGENKGQIRIIDAASFVERFSLFAYSNSVTGLKFTPDGHRLISSGWSRKVIVWDLATRGPVFELTNHATWVSSLAISPDGSRLATASADQTVRLWDLTRGREISQLRGHLGEVWTLAFTPDGQKIISGAKDDTVKVWSVGPQDTNALAVPSGTQQVQFSSDGTVFVAVNNRSQMIVGDARTMQPIENIRRQSGIRSIAFSPDGRSLATGNALGQLQLWDTSRWRELRRATNHSAPVYRVHFSKAGDTIATLDTGGRYVVQSRLTWKVICSGHIENKFFNEHRIAFGADHKLVAVVAGRRVRLIDLQKNQQFVAWEGHREQVRQVAYSPDGDTLACAGEDGTIRLWNIASQRETAMLRGHRNGAYWVEFSADGHRLISGGGEGVIKVWDLSTHREVAAFVIGGGIGPAFLASDGNTLLARSRGEWHFWRAPAWQEIEEVERLRRNP